MRYEVGEKVVLKNRHDVIGHSNAVEIVRINYKLSKYISEEVVDGYFDDKDIDDEKTAEYNRKNNDLRDKLKRVFKGEESWETVENVIQPNHYQKNDKDLIEIWKDIPTLPPVVAEVMQVHKAAGFETLLESLDDIEQLKKNTSDSKYNEVVTWLVTDNNLEMYTLAWILNIYKVTKTYIVQNNEGTILLIKYDGKVTEPKGHSVNDESFNYHLTEQEIKDFDPRYWEFADPVDEDV